MLDSVALKLPLAEPNLWAVAACHHTNRRRTAPRLAIKFTNDQSNNSEDH
jgi:hypothetical protein